MIWVGIIIDSSHWYDIDINFDLRIKSHKPIYLVYQNKQYNIPPVQSQAQLYS